MPQIRAVSDQIKQVVLNLLNNAEQAIEDGVGVIKINTARLDAGIKVRIQDNGCGIPPENMKRVLEPFFSTKAVKGTGLGLAVSYGIIKHHGGEIEVESQLGNGSSFTITLSLE